MTATPAELIERAFFEIIHRWELGPATTAIVTGTDVIFTGDGKIARFYTLVD